VRVTAQLNFDRVERSSEKMDPDTGVVLEENSHNDDVAGKAAEAGVPGISVSGTNNASAAPGARKQKIITNRFHYDTLTEKMVTEVGALKRLSVAVLVAMRPAPAPAPGAAPASPVARTPQELTALTEVIRSAVGFASERKDVIKVEEVAFSESGAAAAAAGVPPPPVAVNPWLEFLKEHFSDALAFAGILVMAVVFWRLLAKPAAPPVPHVMQMPATVTAGAPESETRTSVQTELKELVTQNNAQAVSIIRAMLR
jgi:flagellar M-ring protein FliF